MALAINEALLVNGPSRMDSGEAAHYVVVRLLRQEGGGAVWQKVFGIREMTWDNNPDGRLRSFLAGTVVPKLADAGCFELV